MSRIDELIQELCPDGVERKALGQVGKFTRGIGLQKSDLRDEGIPAVHYGQIHTFYGVWATETMSFTDKETAKKLRHARPGDLLIATTSEDDDAVAKATAWVGDTDVVVGGDAYIYRHELEPKYAAYFFQSTLFQDQKRRFISGTKVRRISGASLEKIRIPAPPLEVQCEIVRVLDTFTDLEAELETELEARRAQYDFYFRRLLSFAPGEAEELTLADIGRVAMCKRVFKNETSDSGEVPFFKIGTFGGSPDAYISRELFDSYRERFSFPKRGDVLISAAGTIGRTVVYDGDLAYFQDSNIVWLDHDESIVSNAYLKHWYRAVDWATDGGTIKRLYNANLLRAKIMVPPRSEQDRIVAMLDKFDALVNDVRIGLPAELAARRKQYEYYRDRLLTFKELVA
ncbi:restriction endonuclease subunit S [Nocardia cyriacigeorgica]|uniref:restriction endonuclease subunit S n=1 Tax=Nocardia cyriacigeorgica TaxID=135487 RepID=UPI002491874D|nr:restriction endonuclease subunit S [Nocardia cyriacigeorgica]BDU05662.1 hypothetical protein FMUBM48_19250 [Nocardia cyriacigeorgica]